MDESVEELDYFSGRYGLRDGHSWRSRKLGPFMDLVFDVPLVLRRAHARISQRAAALPVQKILLTSVEVPSRKADLQAIVETLKRSKHDITVALAPMGDRGKYQNINVALQGIDLSQYDWLIVTDDDVALPPNFMDNFVYLMVKGNLKMAMAAHKFYSYVGYDVTYRKFNSLVRTTHYVECGPVTAFHRDTFSKIIPFPELRWAWGMDIQWSEIARAEGWPIGIVDATPLRHLKKIAASYKANDAMMEGKRFLKESGVVYRPREEILRTVKVLEVL